MAAGTDKFAFAGGAATSLVADVAREAISGIAAG
jgi:hypothetical protein